MTMIKRYCIYIPGPCDVWPAPSLHAAEKMAAIHNNAIIPHLTARLEQMDELSRKCTPPIESVTASVIEWPWCEESHVEGIAEWEPEHWGLRSLAKVLFHDGACLVTTFDSLIDILPEYEGAYIVDHVLMTPAEYEALPEFEA